MVGITKPDVVACPFCGHRFLRRVRPPINAPARITFSDGGSKNVYTKETIRLGRCTQCRKIITNISDLPRINTDAELPFWQKWCTRSPAYLYLPTPSFDVYVDMFAQAPSIFHKRSSSINAFRAFNQNYCLPNTSRVASSAEQRDYKLVTNFILANKMKPAVDQYSLICAEIYRLRGKFFLAKQIYAKLSKPAYKLIGEQGKQWCEAKNKHLMVIQDSNQQQSVVIV